MRRRPGRSALLEPGADGRPPRRGRAHRRLGVRARRRRRRDAVVRGAGTASRRRPGRCRSSSASRCSTSRWATARCGPARPRGTRRARGRAAGALGRVGAGTGARSTSGAGRDRPVPAGSAARPSADGDLVVAALLAVNAFGDIESTAGARLPPPPPETGRHETEEHDRSGVVATNARARQGRLPARGPGRPRRHGPRPRPAHTPVDGDAFVAAATGRVDAAVDRVRSLAVRGSRAGRASAAPVSRRAPPG